MSTENLSTLRINKLSQEQYDRESTAGKLNENEIYLTPDRSITIWQPNTEYKVGDVVIANLEEVLVFEDNIYGYNYPYRTIIANCIIQHTSEDRFKLPNWTGEGVADTWEILQETKAYYDALGRGIHNTYATKDYVDNYLGGLSGGIVRIIVDKLPTTPSEINESAIYMIPSQDGTENNIYDEYMFFDDNGVLKPEIIGSTAVDLSNYYTKTEIDNITKVFVHSDTLASDYYNVSYIDRVVNGADSRISNIESSLGDIESVLDELHNYAQTLITEGVEQ